MGRSPCCEKAHTNKGAWSKEEDERLIDHIRKHGEGCWRSLPQAAGLLRCGKSCRLRWINYLRPDVKRGNFTPQEDQLIIKLHSLLGNKWSLIAARLPGRTDNEIKNYWNTHIRRKLLSEGVDPSTHARMQQRPDLAIVSFAKKESESIERGEEVRELYNYKCPDLNLELTIAPPCNSQPHELVVMRRDHIKDINKAVICFSCKLGLQSKKDCRCNNINIINDDKVMINNISRGFLGLCNIGHAASRPQDHALK